MNRFSYGLADETADIAQVASAERARARSGLSLDDDANVGLRLGAFVTNADIAYDPRTVRRYPLLVAAILAGASPQLRNTATSGGNLDQRTRCYYFYEPEADSVGNDPGTQSTHGGVRCVHEIL